MRRARIAGLLLAFFALGAGGCASETRYPPGVLTPDDPVQETLKSAPVFQMKEYVIRPMARFRVEARVLGTERYRFGRAADLSPVDFALGWGPMSDQAVLDQIDISQGGRFYHWQVKKYPIPRKEIITHSANMHMIPAGDGVRDDLLAVRAGDLVRIEGYLVAITARDGWHWRSSMTRKDSGNGACEVIWVEEATVFETAASATTY